MAKSTRLRLEVDGAPKPFKLHDSEDRPVPMEPYAGAAAMD
jgi:hypothetical protein